MAVDFEEITNLQDRIVIKVDMCKTYDKCNIHEASKVSSELQIV